MKRKRRVFSPCVSARNIGPIAQADIHLRPLTILTGPGGSGKSTIARLLHALWSSLSQEPRLHVESLSAELRRSMGAGSQASGTKASGLRRLIRMGSEKEGAEIRLKDKALFGFSSVASIDEDGHMLIRNRKMGQRSKDRRQPQIHFFPAGRDGLAKASLQATRAMILRNLAWSGPDIQIPGPESDFLLAFASGPGGPRPKDAPFQGLADSLQKKVLRARFEKAQGPQGIPSPILLKASGESRAIPLEETSSSQASIAPMVLALRDSAQKGDMIVIEEPESHLHPDAQILLAREIAGWVREGLRVLLTTHSEWIVEAFANIVAIDEKQLEGGLPVSDVGVWSFRRASTRKADGFAAKEVPFDPDEGGYPVDFDQAVSDLQNEWASLMSDDDE